MDASPPSYGKSGDLLWQYDTGAVIWAPPATFASNGERYVLVASGGPGAMNVPELNKTIGPKGWHHAMPTCNRVDPLVSARSECKRARLLCPFLATSRMPRLRVGNLSKMGFNSTESFQYT